MPSQLVFLVLTLLGGSAYTLPTRIVAGSETTIDKYPSIVAVESHSAWSGSWSQNCAASILTYRYVLSAAHCFMGSFSDISQRRIRAGSSYSNTGGIIAYAEANFNHPSYGQWAFDGDLSVIRLTAPLVFSPVKAGTIIAQGITIPDNLPVVHAGWGSTTQGGQFSPVLRDVTIYTINNELCAERYQTLPIPGFVTENPWSVHGVSCTFFSIEIYALERAI